jgi:hypothetical protein
MVYYLAYKCPWEKYPVSKYLDGNEHEVVLEDSSPENRILSITNRRSEYILGLRVNPHNVPTKMQWRSRVSPTDYDTPGGFPCVSPRMKEIIERFEPGVHQFFPLKVVNRAGEEIAQRWLWVVCNRIDSVDREHTNWFFLHGSRWTPSYLQNGEVIAVENPKLTFSKSKSEGYHFWRDKHLMSSYGIFCSDDAAQALQGANLSALAVAPAETI